MDIRKYIDSVVGNIARKIEDEFNEADHPRDKGGKFTTKGNEGKGGPDTAKTFHSSEKVAKETEQNLRERYASKHGGELLPETSKEKAAKEELGEGVGTTEELVESAIEKYISGDSYDEVREFIRKMGDDPSNYPGSDADAYIRAIEKNIKKNPKRARELLEGSARADEEMLEGLDDYGEKLLEYASDLDTANDALRALNWDSYDYEDLEQAHTALKEAISQNPKAAKELWESTVNKEDGSDKNVSRLKEIAADGFSEYPEMRKDFLKSMGVKLPKLSAEEREYYSEYPEEYDAMLQKKVEEAIEANPKAAKEALGEWADEN